LFEYSITALLSVWHEAPLAVASEVVEAVTALSDVIAILFTAPSKAAIKICEILIKLILFVFY
jgi:hypothetical protein